MRMLIAMADVHTVSQVSNQSGRRHVLTIKFYKYDLFQAESAICTHGESAS